MDREEIIKKAETGEGLTVEEIKIYQEAVRPKKQVYGKYGTLPKLLTKRLICSILDIPYYVGYKRLGEVYGVCRI